MPFAPDDRLAAGTVALLARAAIVLLAAAAPACGGGGSPEPPLVPLARLLDSVGPVENGALSGREQPELVDERKPVHSVGRTAPAAILCKGRGSGAEPGPLTRCVGRAAKRGPDAGWAIFRTLPHDELRKRAGLPPEAKSSSEPRSAAMELRKAQRRGWEIPHWQTSWLEYTLVPRLEDRDFASRKVEIPPRARLRFAIAAEETTWDVDAAPVDFTVRAESDDGSPEIFRRTLDPSHRREDRGWHEVDVPLGELAGKRVSFHFEVRLRDPADRRPQLPLWGDPRVVAPAETRGRASIVLVSLDTLRARSMSAYGYELPTTPEFQRIAREGALFTNAFTTFSNTLGAHMSMLTGLYPANHGVGAATSLSRARPTLAERLRGAGYETAAITENGLITARAGFARGFAHYVEDKTSAWHAVGAARTFRRALTWAEAHADEPFFLFVHTYAVHAPYEPSASYRELFTAAPTPSGNQLPYEREVREVDDELARLVAELDRLLGRERYLLVVTADHGEEFYEHGLMFHVQLYDEVMHVPLLFRWPGRIPEDRVIDQLVSLVDVAPTILGLVGVSDRGGNDGLDLSSLIEGGTPPPVLPRQVVFGEAPRIQRSEGARTYVARSETAKCMLAAKASEAHCFDLKADPRERNPLSPSSSAALTELAGEVSRYRDRAKQVPPAHAPVAVPEAPDIQREQQLRALGYIE
jgi:arylsulfatase A-like enzyme